MPIDIHDSRETHGVVWSGWDATLVDALLDAETGTEAVGFTLARVLASRLLPSPSARFRFRLYRYSHEEGTYRFVGAWDEHCLEEDAVPQPEEVLERQEAQAAPPDPETRGDSFLDDELFLPLETKNGVLGFGVLRIDSRHEPTRVSSQELHFLGRLGGAALGRLNESDRAVRMHRSFESATRHLDAVLSLTIEAILLVDVNGIVRIANDAALALLGQTGRHLLGRPISSVLSPDAAGSLHRTLLEAEETDGRISGQIMMAQNGELRPFEVAVQQLQPDLEADPTLLVRFQAADSASHRHSSTADERPPLASAAIPPEGEECSPAASGLSVVMSSEAGTFASPVADEAETLRRHVKSIRGYVGFLRDEVHPHGRTFDLFAQLEAQLESLQAETDIHTLLVAIRTGQITWQNRSVPTATLIDRVLSRMSSRLSLRGIEVERSAAAETRRLRLDVEKWSVVLGVLLDRATENDGIRRMSLRVSDGPGCAVVLEPHSSVDDDSLFIGVTEDDGSHGLTLVRYVVALHGGTIRTIVSEAGHPAVRLDLPEGFDLRGQHGRAA